MIYESPHPPVDLPLCSVWDKGAPPSPRVDVSPPGLLTLTLRFPPAAVWQNPTGASDSKDAVIDGPTGRKLRCVQLRDEDRSTTLAPLSSAEWIPSRWAFFSQGVIAR